MTSSAMTGKLISQWTTVEGTRIHAVASGIPVPADSPVVVLVHGVGASHRYMLPTLLRLASDCRVFAIDLPGFGMSDKPSHALTLPELTDALAGWTRLRGLQGATFLGNSYGCQVLVDLAVRHPDCPGRLVLQGPTVDRRARSMIWQWLRWTCNGMLESKSKSFVTMRDYYDAGVRRVYWTFRHALHDRVEEKLSRVHVPTLVVRGSRDIIVPQAWAEEVARRLPQGQLTIIPGAPHTINYETPGEMARVVRGFLGTTGPERERPATDRTPQKVLQNTEG